MEISESVDQLFEAILTLKNKEECYKFFADACTPKEIQTIAQRYMVAKMLADKRVYSDIIAATGASTATVSRVSRSINEGYKIVFERLKNNNACDCSGKSLKLPHRCAGIEITPATFTYIKLFFIL